VRKRKSGRTDAGGAGLAELVELALVVDVAQVVGRLGAAALGEAQLEAAPLGDNVRDLILLRTFEVSSRRPEGQEGREERTRVKTFFCSRSRSSGRKRSSASWTWVRESV